VASRAIYALLVLLLVTSVPAPADILFTDNTFIPATYNYFSASPNLDSGVTATYGQCISCGNPEQALEAIVSIPTPGGAFVGFLNNTFVYNPQTEGAILSLTASVDKNLSLDRSTTYFASFFYPLIEQSGISISPVSLEVRSTPAPRPVTRQSAKAWRLPTSACTISARLLFRISAATRTSLPVAPPLFSGSRRW
jgi:hypothetical protein